MREVVIGNDVAGATWGDRVFEELIKRGWKVALAGEYNWKEPGDIDIVQYERSKEDEERYGKYGTTMRRRDSSIAFRSHPDVLALVKEFGNDLLRKESWNRHENRELLSIVEIPDEVEAFIQEGDCGGGEFVCEVHRTWDEDGEGGTFCRTEGEK